jgi:predicted RNA-binding Zn ribbon-like protein
VAQIRRHPFKLVGGHPALDFVNTVHDWSVSEPHDYLSEFADAIRFGKAAGLLTRADDLLPRQRTPRLELTRLRELRALLKRIFQTRLSGQAPNDMDLGNLSTDLAEAARTSRLKSCPTCGWLFLDASKNRSRRWCSMDTCGAVAKARRYYRRLKDGVDH